MTTNELNPTLYGWGLEHTGGGCMAWAVNLGIGRSQAHNRHMLATDDGGVPEAASTGVTVGLYETDDAYCGEASALLFPTLSEFLAVPAAEWLARLTIAARKGQPTREAGLLSCEKCQQLHPGNGLACAQCNATSADRGKTQALCDYGEFAEDAQTALVDHLGDLLIFCAEVNAFTAAEAEPLAVSRETGLVLDFEAALRMGRVHATEEREGGAA